MIAAFYRSEVLLEALVGLHTFVEQTGVVEPFHLAQQAGQFTGIAAIGLPDTFDARRLQIGYLAHLVEEHLWRDMQLHTQLHHLTVIQRLHTHGLLEINFHQKEPIIILPSRRFCHILLFFLQKYIFFRIFATEIAKTYEKNRILCPLRSILHIAVGTKRA